MAGSGKVAFTAQETGGGAVNTSPRACGTPNPEAQDDRRQSQRFRSIGRALLLVAPSNSGLCRLHNLSNDGLMIETTVPLDTGDSVQVWLDQASTAEGRVVWSRANFAGIEFSRNIDAFSLMRKTADEHWAGLARPPRLPIESIGSAMTSQGPFAIVVANISQKGMMIRHSANIVAGMEIEVFLESGLKALGTVRWSNQTLAGVEFSGKVTIDQLGRASEL